MFFLIDPKNNICFVPVLCTCAVCCWTEVRDRWRVFSACSHAQQHLFKEPKHVSLTCLLSNTCVPHIYALVWQMQEFTLSNAGILSIHAQPESIFYAEWGSDLSREHLECEKCPFCLEAIPASPNVHNPHFCANFLCTMVASWFTPHLIQKPKGLK